METPDKCVKSVEVNVFDVALVSLLLTSNTFHILLECFSVSIEFEQVKHRLGNKIPNMITGIPQQCLQCGFEDLLNFGQGLQHFLVLLL